MDEMPKLVRHKTISPKRMVRPDLKKSLTARRLQEMIDQSKIQTVNTGVESDNKE